MPFKCLKGKRKRESAHWLISARVLSRLVWCGAKHSLTFQDIGRENSAAGIEHERMKRAHLPCYSD